MCRKVRYGSESVKFYKFSLNYKAIMVRSGLYMRLHQGLV